MLNCFGGSSQVHQTPEEVSLRARVAQLESELSEAKKEARLARSSSRLDDGSSKASPGHGVSRSVGRRSSAAKLEALQETGDDATQKYIKSQFVNDDIPKPTLRGSAAAVLAANRLGRLSDGTARLSDITSNGTARTMSPANVRLSHHAAAKVVPSRFLPEAVTDEQLDVVVATIAEMDAAEWRCDVIPLCDILVSPMTFIVSSVLRSWNAARLFSTDESAIIELLEKLEHGYLRTNPYHNATHAADVAYTTHVMLRQGVQAALGLSQLQCAVAVLAAAAHDFRHPGIGANYLIAVGDELALTYNDKSPLESFHVSEFFKLLAANPKLDIFAKLDKKERADVRKATIGMIMATDMSVHFDFLDKFIKRFPAASGEAAAACDGGSAPNSPRPSSPTSYSLEDQNFALAMLLHCADISNPAKPTPAYTDWTDRVLAEFYHQGGKEDAAGLPISPLFDKRSPSVAKMQTGFMQFIVRPIFAAWTDFVPALRPITMPHLEANQALWKGDTPHIPADQPFVDEQRTDWDWERGVWR